ncbi:TIGR03016 family PEP-CTERM system-associated outer membrane protein [Rubrivivax gelatinosus]|nr:TIGR03016 family PEP-CTERM system-associated outer membrane protein [Rubrivivax gelatinosus]
MRRIAVCAARRVPVRPAPMAAAVLAAVAAGATPALAQQAGGFTFERSIDLQQTFTDNGQLSERDRQAESITRVSPGVRVSGRSGRVQGSLDYRLDLVQYARDSGRSTTHNQLAAEGAAELVPEHVFLDANASISQQAISAFGKQSSGTGIENSNSSEVAMVAVSPTAKARLAGVFDVSANAAWSTTRAKDSSAGDRTEWDAGVSIGATHGIFGWAVSGSRQSSGYSAGGDDSTTENVSASVSAALTPRLQVFATHGEERSDLLGNGTQSSSTNGWGLNWQPSVRTQFSAQSDRHFYGNSHSLSLTHRFRRSMLSYTDSRGVGGQDNQLLGELRNTYGQLFSGCMATVGDAAWCQSVVRQLLGFDATTPLGFLNSAPSLQRTQTLVFALNGLRNNFSIAASHNETSRLGDQTYTGGDLAIVPRVRQYGLTMNLTHKLSRQMSLGVTAAAMKTLDEDTQPGNEQRRVELSLSNEFGARTSGTLALRHVRFDSETSPYRESALIGSLNYRF